MEPVVRPPSNASWTDGCPYCPISDPAVKVIVEDDLVRFAQNERVQVALKLSDAFTRPRFRLSTWSTRCSPASTVMNGALHAFIDVYARDARLPRGGGSGDPSGQAWAVARGAGRAQGSRRSGGSVTTGGSKSGEKRVSPLTATLARNSSQAGMIVPARRTGRVRDGPVGGAELKRAYEQR